MHVCEIRSLFTLNCQHKALKGIKVQRPTLFVLVLLASGSRLRSIWLNVLRVQLVLFVLPGQVRLLLGRRGSSRGLSLRCLGRGWLRLWWCHDLLLV